MSPRSRVEAVRIGRRTVDITRPEKVLFPEDAITKREVVEYYRRVAPVMLPHLRDRPLSMERYPDGIRGEKIFQKNSSAYYPEWIKTVSVPKQGGVVRHVICNDAATLVYLANQAVITPHTWLSRSSAIDRPDQMIFDLDPSNDDFRSVCECAKALRQLLLEVGLESFVKTTGSRGLHVLVPLKRRPDFNQVRAFARQIAEHLARNDPGRVTTEVRKNLRTAPIFLDTARNAYAQTAAPAYAIRPRPGAPVATPLDWEELDGRGLLPNAYTIRNIFSRIEKLGDPWKDLKQHAQTLPRPPD